MKKTLTRFAAAVALLLGVGAVLDAQTYIRTIVGSTRFKSPVLFEQEVTMSGNTGSLAGADVSASDDLTVGDDAAITGDLAVTGATTLTGGIVNGSNLFTTANVARVYSGNTTLTEAGGVETILTVTNATLTGFGGVMNFRVVGTDGTDVQVRTGTLIFSGVNKAGTTTCVESTADETGSIAALSSGTLTYALVGTPGANTCIVTINIDSSLTLTSASIAWKLELYGPGTVS